ncbi:UDP-N-acetylmuramoyl-L-alanyl-D-glutamate--2,6-diaminopimelate ligase [Pseudorhodoferax sp. Leaf267]|uniref:UDP-N-acetylmuramoyl-L-alanyl-D-glutamate--2, 6-diaminopimelate ligase n=1 Tax=Pseudorhodoferax sp. Leaf267 TaxID=1736316 RepID=UPI000700D4AA|nr:UDP-N-acetylmuramoyl-L-alanyl-D-glutamate--2,6-diaminopimelate ligase [Pseudorhodoferax sp. Leaf267]KQP14132.1 UDP-N-acetylmuramoylalanyl-D-glutamate--2,6-diaminopimelate ligase [Pseudorhodoferax sp. Leaf267]
MRELASTTEAAAWLRGRVTGALHTDSRRVGPGDGFIAWPGAAVDGRRFVGQALEQGATACLVERVGSEAFGFDAEGVAAFTGLKAGSGPIAAAYFEQPSQALDVLAVTGTNGKTSTAWWLAQALTQAQQQAGTTPRGCAVVGTLGTGVPPSVVSTGMTTPDPVLLQARLREFVTTGLTACAIEASSIGIAERRLDGTRIRLAIFTNFTQDHLDYHGSMAAYWQAKAELFAWPGLAAAVVNLDDAQGRTLAADLAGKDLDLWTISVTRPARLVAADIAYENDGLAFTVHEGAAHARLATPLIGQYNVSNLLGVIAALRALGFGLDAAAQGCVGLLPVPGRMERLAAPGQPMVAIDYAHTPDALEQALQALRPLADERGGRLWCVFGCGGNRDAGKRPMMAAVAERRADTVVVTSDNPRHEAPEAIIGQIVAGLARPDAAHVQADRARAIAETLVQAGPADVVLLAGKGHEDSQEIAGVKLPFSDHQHAQAALAARAAGAAA